MQLWDDLSKGIGILGGTFDPIHRAHTEIARLVNERYGLAGVVIIPAFRNPLREHEQILAGTEDRLVMAYLATLDNPLLLVDPSEIERGRRQPGPSYTIDTLMTYHMRYPGAPITLITGADNIAFHRWKDADMFPDYLARVVAVARPDYEDRFEKDLKEAKERYPKLAALVEFLSDVSIPASSTAVRESLRNGKVPENVLHPAVVKHILKYGLYGCREACTI